MFKKTKKTLKPGNVILVRHGSTLWNDKDKSIDRIRGHIDVPLDEEGIKDAEKAADKLKKTPFNIIFSSDLSRAVQTAEIVNEGHNVPIVKMNALRPWDLGIYQGKVTENVIDDLNKYIVYENKRPPGSTESFKEFRIRYITCLKNIINTAIKKHEDIIVTTHLRNLKLADGWIKKGMPEDCSVDKNVVQEEEFDPGTLFEIPIGTKLIK